jgi:hypothetical protein
MGPTSDKPEVIVAPLRSALVLTSALNNRVTDVQAVYEWRTRGSEFLTELKTLATKSAARQGSRPSSYRGWSIDQRKFNG